MNQPQALQPLTVNEIIEDIKERFADADLDLNSTQKDIYDRAIDRFIRNAETFRAAQHRNDESALNKIRSDLVWIRGTLEQSELITRQKAYVTFAETMDLYKDTGQEAAASILKVVVRILAGMFLTGQLPKVG